MKAVFLPSRTKTPGKKNTDKHSTAKNNNKKKPFQQNSKQDILQSHGAHGDE